MKKIFVLISLLFIFLLISPQQTSAKLEIYSGNPYFLEYDGEPFMNMPFDVDVSGMKHSRKMISSGVGFSLYSSSRRFCGVNWFEKSNLLYIDGIMKNGFNEIIWDNIKQVVSEAHNKGEIVNFGIWATTRLEYGISGETPADYKAIGDCKDSVYNCECNYNDPAASNYWAPDRFEASMWSELRGGPIPQEGYPKDNFYTLYDYENPINEPYDDSWPWQKKNQYFQEELIRKAYSELSAYDNWMFQPMYEIDDTGGTNVNKALRWVEHITDYCRSLNPDILIVFCGNSASSPFLQSGNFDVISSEGSVDSIDFPYRMKNLFWKFNMPLIYTGYDPFNKKGERMDNQDNIPDDYENDISYDYNMEVMRNFVLNGINPAPFFHYQSYAQYYPYSDIINEYAQTLADFFETINDWNDEPGDEINENAVPPIPYIGDKYEEDNSCSGKGGYVCSGSQTCTGQWISASDTQKCCSVACKDNCNDGTIHGQCSVTKPKYCNDGNLIDDCQKCGCPQELVCGGGSCITPLTISILRGWNIVYMPTEDNIQISQLQDSCGSVSLFSLENGKLGPETVLSSGKSYLMRSRNSCIIKLNKTRMQEEPIQISKGWNVVGTQADINYEDMGNECNKPLVFTLNKGRLFSLKQGDKLRKDNAYLVRSDTGCVFKRN